MTYSFSFDLIKMFIWLVGFLAIYNMLGVIIEYRMKCFKQSLFWTLLFAYILTFICEGV